MKNWTIATPPEYEGEAVVFRVLENGAHESCLIGSPEIKKYIETGNILEPYKKPTPTIQDYQAAIQQLVEETAQSKQYDTAANLASYVASTIPVWAAQAQTFVAWRDAVWQYTYQQLEQVQLGLREQPSVADFLTELPVIDWNEQ